MKKIIIPAACLLFISPAVAREKTYKEAGFCDMIAVRDTRAVQGAARPVKKGEKIMMVQRLMEKNGDIFLSEYRCCDYRPSDFKYAGKRCRLPAPVKWWESK